MELNEGQFERIAEWLDGRDVELSAEERTVGEGIRRRQASLGGLLDVQLPPGAYARARHALRRQVRRPRHRVLRIMIEIAAVAAAAVVIMALLLPPHAPALARQVPTAVLFEDAYRSDGAVELDTIAQQMDQVETRLLASLPPVPEEGLARPAANEETGKVFDDPWLEELLQNLAS